MKLPARAVSREAGEVDYQPALKRCELLIPFGPNLSDFAGEIYWVVKGRLNKCHGALTRQFAGRIILQCNGVCVYVRGGGAGGGWGWVGVGVLRWGWVGGGSSGIRIAPFSD